jgi:hypothetical protein
MSDSNGGGCVPKKIKQHGLAGLAKKTGSLAIPKK